MVQPELMVYLKQAVHQVQAVVQAAQAAQVLQVLMEAQEYPQQAVLQVQAAHLDLVDQMAPLD
jgi:hypothetical protein